MFLYALINETLEMQSVVENAKMGLYSGAVVVVKTILLMIVLPRSQRCYQ